MPFVTFTVRRGLSAADKSRLSEVMLEAQVAAGYHRADRFHRFLEVDQDDLLVDPRFPDYATDRTDRFMVVEVIISSGMPTGTAATIADEAVREWGGGCGGGVGLFEKAIPCGRVCSSWPLIATPRRMLDGGALGLPIWLPFKPIRVVRRGVTRLFGQVGLRSPRQKRTTAFM